MPTFVLASTIAWLYAVDLPLPLELTALVMVGAILKVFLRRDDNRFGRLERDVEKLRQEASQQRHLKHQEINRVAAIKGTLQLVLAEARDCTCGALVPLLPLLEQLLVKEDNP